VKKPSKNSIWVEKRLLNSRAYSDLKTHSPKVLTWFFLKRQMVKYKDSKSNENWIIKNNGSIVFTYKEAERKRALSKKKFVCALDDLIAKGFLAVTHQGTGQNDYSRYKLTTNWKDYGTKDFKPCPQRRKNKSKNMGWAIYNARQKKLGVQSDNRPGAESDTSTGITKKYRVSKVTSDDRGLNDAYN
jgi:hypothetical protein